MFQFTDPLKVVLTAGRRYRRWRRKRTAIEELRRLSDHALKDIGLSRAEIPAVVEALTAQETASDQPDRPQATDYVRDWRRATRRRADTGAGGPEFDQQPCCS